jgi:glycosyltransferase involved in cell wall biosynthesis
MKRLLFIAFYFPPLNQVASYRPGCFARYLPENGWLPTVICAEDAPASPLEPALPPGVEVIRLPSMGPKNPLLKILFRKLLPYCQPHHAPFVWWRAATKVVRDLSRAVHFDAIWVTSDPIVTLALGAEAAARLDLPWIADLRDSFNVQQFGSWHKRPIWAYHERRLCRKANMVVTVSEHMGRGLGHATGRPIRILENGFDPELFSPAPPPRRDIFTLTYTGTFHSPQQDPGPVLEAVATLLRTGAIPRNKIELLFYQPKAEQINLAYPGATSSLPVRVFPRLPHKEITAVQQASAALLLLTVAGQKGVLTAKLFDYLAAGRPVLAVPGDEGDVASLLKRTGAGVVASAPVEIAGVLKHWYEQWEATGAIAMPRDEAHIQSYSRRQQTRRLAKMLDSVAGSPRLHS